MVTAIRPSVVQHITISGSTSQSSSQAVALVRLTVQYLNYAKLTALSETLVVFRQQIQESMVSWANLSLAPHQIRLELKPGSVLVKASIRDLSPAPIKKWTSEMHATRLLKAKLEASISSIAGIHSACTGPIAITDITVTAQDAPGMTSPLVVALIVVNTLFILGMLLLAWFLIGPNPVLSWCHSRAEADSTSLQPRVSVEVFHGSNPHLGEEFQALQKKGWSGDFGSQWAQERRILVQRIPNLPRRQTRPAPRSESLQTIFETDSDGATMSPVATPVNAGSINWDATPDNPLAHGDSFACQARDLGFSDKTSREVLEECGGNKDRALALLSAA